VAPTFQKACAMSKPRVLICTLTGSERWQWICPEQNQMIFAMARDTRFAVDMATVKAVPHEVARNHTIKIARDNGFDWMVSLDNDNFMPQGTPLDIIHQATKSQDVIGLTYGVSVAPSAPNGVTGAFQFFPPPECHGRADGPFREVPEVGGGILIVNRRVWERLNTGPWFQWCPGTGTETLDRGEGGCGEDVAFCKLVRERGLSVWTHAGLLAGHHKTVDLTAMVTTFAHLTQKAAAWGTIKPMRAPEREGNAMLASPSVRSAEMEGSK
jgi:hypothetical protein